MINITSCSQAFRIGSATRIMSVVGFYRCMLATRCPDSDNPLTTDSRLCFARSQLEGEKAKLSA